MIYMKYKRLKRMEFYQFVNSLGEIGLYRFDGYYYCDEWNEDALMLHDPVRGRFEWPSCEFQAALDPEDDQKNF